MILNELYKTDFEIKNIVSLKQTWNSGVAFRMDHPRPQNGIIYLKGCTGIYTSKSGKSFRAGKGSVVWLPEQSRYICYNESAENTETDAYLVQFNMYHNDRKIIISDSPFPVNSANNYAILSKFMELSELTDATLLSPAAIKGATYSLISMLCREYSHNINRKYDSISKGIEYIEKNPTSATPIDDIARMCNVSTGSFRRLFKEYSGKTPVEFRIDKQIDIAKTLLTGEYLTLGDICARIEIDNVPYFCKLFLKKTGMTPTQYRKNMLFERSLL